MFWSTSSSNTKCVVYNHLVRGRKIYEFVKTLSMFCCYRHTFLLDLLSNWDYAVRVIFCNVGVHKVIRDHHWHVVESSCKVTNLCALKSLFKILSPPAMLWYNFKTKVQEHMITLALLSTWGFKDLVSVLGGGASCRYFPASFLCTSISWQPLRCLLRERSRLERLLQVCTKNNMQLVGLLDSFLAQVKMKSRNLHFPLYLFFFLLPSEWILVLTKKLPVWS